MLIAPILQRLAPAISSLQRLAPAISSLDCVRPVVTGCGRAGPRAPARQMVVRFILCLCLEEIGVMGTSKTQVSPETPVWLHCPSLYSVQYLLHPTHPSLSPTPSQQSTCSASAHRGRALPPVRWLFDVFCACVGRRLGSREPAKLVQYSRLFRAHVHVPSLQST